jgi:hypothetical protein
MCANTLTICRVRGLVCPVGSIDIYRFAAQNPSAHVDSRRARSKHSIFPASAGRACSQACPVCTRPRPSERLSLPGRSHRDLSICSAKPQRARRFAARALETFDFPGISRESMLAGFPRMHQASAECTAWFTQSVASRSIDMQRKTPARTSIGRARARNIRPLRGGGRSAGAAAAAAPAPPRPARPRRAPP